MHTHPNPLTHTHISPCTSTKPQGTAGFAVILVMVVVPQVNAAMDNRMLWALFIVITILEPFSGTLLGWRGGVADGAGVVQGGGSSEAEGRVRKHNVPIPLSRTTFLTPFSLPFFLPQAA